MLRVTSFPGYSTCLSKLKPISPGAPWLLGSLFLLFAPGAAGSCSFPRTPLLGEGAKEGPRG